jgi:hypothetical protein
MSAITEWNREYGRRDQFLWPHDNLYQQKLTLTSPTSVGLSVTIVRSRTEAMQLVRDIHESAQYDTQPHS